MKTVIILVFLIVSLRVYVCVRCTGIYDSGVPSFWSVSHSPLDYFHTIYLKDSPRSRTYSCSSQCEVIHLLSNAHIFISRLSICLPKDSLANCCTCTFTF